MRISQDSGKKIRFTYNNVSANPDFEKIAASKYQTYYFEPFSQTHNRYFGSEAGLEYLSQFHKSGIIFPQFHGREHLHAPFWLEQLRNGDKVFLKAFQLRFWGIGKDIYSKPLRNIQATFDIRGESDLLFAIKALQEGLSIHKSIFEEESKSFIPNNYIWPPTLNKTIFNAGVRYLQGMKKQVDPKSEKEEKRSYSLRRAGHETQNGMINLVRNTSFEPSLYNDGHKEIKKCLNEIQTAFFFKQPAVISTHRINFVGGLVESNRTNNLKLFTTLVKNIIKKWPEVEFMNSVQLGDYYRKLYY